jgi:NADH dehydrogenase/NADH:ubiquinone oxidoreductase subunit G
MAILANTDRIRHLRRNIAELLVAQAPNSRDIQDIAVRCGVNNVRYPFRNDQCVLCGRCVWACAEIWKARAIVFIWRGKERHVDFPFGVRSEFCKHCENCDSQLLTNENTPGTCVWCKLGEHIGCVRYS